MNEQKTWWESIRVEGGEIVGRIRRIVHEGNVRRIVVKQQGQTVAEFPLTFGVVGTVISPMLAAIGALTALLTDCSIEIERTEKPGPYPDPSRPAGR
ncbi:MAG: DUF4342 domain-containing protein [Acidobacteria bacterium]|nr:DUF4342 domain-containing protein [Acidobacteriota bacterium]